MSDGLRPTDGGDIVDEDRRPGRPVLYENEKLTKNLHILVTPSQYQEIVEWVERRGTPRSVSTTAFLREFILRAARKHKEKSNGA